MWPLFTERWGEWRQGQLGLPPLPLHHPASHRPLAGRGELPPAPPLLYGGKRALACSLLGRALR